MQPESPKSFRYNPQFIENWQTAFNQLNCEESGLLLTGGNLTRDGSIHDYEFEAIRLELNTLSYPYYAIPDNMDTGNKHTLVKGATGRDDPSSEVMAKQLDRFAELFGKSPDHLFIRTLASADFTLLSLDLACHTKNKCGIGLKMNFQG